MMNHAAIYTATTALYVRPTAGASMPGISSSDAISSTLIYQVDHASSSFPWIKFKQVADTDVPIVVGFLPQKHAAVPWYAYQQY